jgi:hypothetical protein
MSISGKELESFVRMLKMLMSGVLGLMGSTLSPVSDLGSQEMSASLFNLPISPPKLQDYLQKEGESLEEQY